uniref:Coiled-coil domain-containing protein 39 n=1 Tax=Amazona collaria TaxID=241587 RepID=A0A8B9FRH3_9PSIT
ISNSTASVLAELCWDDGYAVPVANAENKALEDELQKMQKEKLNLKNDLTDFEERIGAMTSHLRNVRQEFSLIQSLYKARENEIETEKHFKALAEREHGRLKNEIKRLEDEIVSLRVKKNSHENTINKTTMKLENLKQQINCDKEVLENWIKESNRKDNDAVTIQKYAQKDEGKLGALTLQVDKLTMQANQKRKALDNELTETITAQIELDKTAEDFRRVHQERQEVIRQWENAIQQMQKRDQQIDHCMLLDFVSVYMLCTLNLINYVISFRLSFLNEKNASLSNKLKLVTEETLSSEDKALRMEEILKEEEKGVKEKDKEINQLKDVLFKKTQEFKVQKDKEKCVIAEIEASRASLKKLQSQLHRLNADALNQQEIIYNQDFYIQQVQRRLSRLEGELNTDEKQVLEAKVAELKKTLEEKKTTYDVLRVQCKKLQNDVHFLKRAMDKTGEETSGMMSKINDLNLFNDRSDQELKKAKAIKQEMMVEDNLLKLELNRLQDILCNKSEKVLTLEKQKLELKKAIAERTEEIKIHKAMLDSQIRLVDQERQRISAEFQDRLNKIRKLRCRYEVLTTAMTPLEGEEEKSQTYCVIKAAQEKEALQCEGDDLDAKICKAEKEIVALENTLCIINNCNSKYRNSFKEVTETSEEYEEKLKLEEEKRAADEKHRYKQRQIKELKEKLQSMEKSFDMVLEQEALFQEQKKEKQALVSQLNKHIEEQKPKLERVIKQCSRLSREIQSQKKTKAETQEEKDIDLRELKSFNRTIDKLLASVLEANPDLTMPFQIYFQQVINVCFRSSRSTSSGTSQTSSLKVIDLCLPIDSPAEAAAVGTQPSSRASTSGICKGKRKS